MNLGNVETPFELYPGDGLSLLPKMTGDTARRHYGLKLQQLTRQTRCAYCDISLVDDFRHWLLLSVDHVIPTAQGKRLGVPNDWCDSYSNIVLCCSGCNGFDNRYQISVDELPENWTVKTFCQLRNRVFSDRKAKILLRSAEEIRFFESEPWSQ